MVTPLRVFLPNLYEGVKEICWGGTYKTYESPLVAAFRSMGIDTFIF